MAAVTISGFTEWVELAKGVTLHLGDCRPVLPMLEQVTALVTDSPYGINYEVSARNWDNKGLKGLEPCAAPARGGVEGDSEPFDPAHLLGFGKVALFGANHMDGLPAGGRWIVWDKRRDSTPDDHSDCELIWTNQKGADRIHRQKWRGVVREGEENCANSKKLHSNQKPVALLGFIFDQIGITDGDVVCDPYMGVGLDRGRGDPARATLHRDREGPAAFRGGAGASVGGNRKAGGRTVISTGG